VFLSVSAFCNAGFSVFSDSAMPLKHSYLALGTLMALIVLGGVGYAVLLETMARTAGRLVGREAPTVRWSLHARIAWRVSAGLIVVGTVLLLLTGLATGVGHGEESLTHALFQSISARTAGFNTVDMGALPTAPLLILIVLMFIGGSPGSCAGGVKTTTVAVWLARVWTRTRGREGVSLWGRELPHDVVRRAALVLALASIWNAVGILVLTITEQGHPNLRFEHVIFEQVSAFATVGLSAGLTSELSVLGKLWIIASMFVGRVGPLTMALAVLTSPRESYRYPEERVMVG
jgi:trk system potassium uptake protein TrkH